MSLFSKKIGLIGLTNMKSRIDEEWIMCDAHNSSIIKVNTENSLKSITKSINQQEKGVNLHNLQCNFNSINRNINININNNISNFKPIIKESDGWIQMLFDAFMNAIEEIDILRIFLFFDEKRIPAISL